MIDDREIEMKNGAYRLFEYDIIWGFLGCLVIGLVHSFFNVELLPLMLLLAGLMIWWSLGFSYKARKNQWRLLRYKGDRVWLWQQDFYILHNYAEAYVRNCSER